MVNTVIFLGAGASKAEGAPLQGELFKKYFKMVPEKRRKVNMLVGYEDINDYTATMMAEFFSELFGINIFQNLEDIIFPTFEEALGIIDLAESKGEKFLTNKNIYTNSGYSNVLQDYWRALDDRRNLILTMAQTIAYSLEETNMQKYHRVLVNKLVQSKLIGNISFISTNYDILIDNALKMYTCIDYGFDHDTKFGNNHCKVNSKLYKIHGSLNWLFCPACNEVNVYDEKVVGHLMDNLLHARCPKCKCLCEPIIIPPTYYKNMRNFYLNKVWNYAEKELCKAEHIIFCGYSFPDADMHIKYLLKRSEVNVVRNLNVTIINNYPDKDQMQKKEEKERYDRFFKRTTNVNYDNRLSFEDFALNPFVVL